MLNWLSELTAFLIPEAAWRDEPQADLFSHGWQFQDTQWWNEQQHEAAEDETAVH
ncbi:hypothetical protein [Chitinilyticum piscinae]|uniref:Uncharacterized protein n=1 Tax=Chitinilyticum piscinae TaxID=2866724 RepID=A0A8J7KD26_9NEIS|nr:hypothetical protein [Chitinilyticum piscinae]MBE9608349.1 hypothetical protein [Chitinilyticum piscinae]